MWTLAYRPFLDPLPLQDLWFLLLIPVSFCVSLAYKAVRVQDMKQLPRQALAMALQVILGMVVLGALLFVVITYLLPHIAPKPS